MYLIKGNVYWYTGNIIAILLVAFIGANFPKLLNYGKQNECKEDNEDIDYPSPIRESSQSVVIDQKELTPTSEYLISSTQDSAPFFLSSPTSPFKTQSHAPHNPLYKLPIMATGPHTPYNNRIRSSINHYNNFNE